MNTMNKNTGPEAPLRSLRVISTPQRIPSPAHAIICVSVATGAQTHRILSEPDTNLDKSAASTVPTRLLRQTKQCHRQRAFA